MNHSRAKAICSELDKRIAQRMPLCWEHYSDELFMTTRRLYRDKTADEVCVKCQRQVSKV